ncbi:MAG: hypothetical protein IKS52_04590 [Clostridia bacterium]|nr:hypothetical protein [Clostridia bacterium]
MTNEQWFEHFVNEAKAAYISVMGESKWNGLTDQQKHDAIMIMAKDMLKALSA